jgi:glucose 1-dehydrogenase
VRALVLRGHAGRGRVAVEEAAEPDPADGELLVEGIAIGICGTDRRLVQRPPRTGADREALVLGHESLGRIIDAPAGSGFEPGDLVAGIVRRPDPEPCFFCAAGEFDLCENGQFVERGISGKDGYGSERYRLEAEYAVRVDPALGLAGVLVESASVVAKAWEKLDGLAWRRRSRALTMGAGPIGLLAALLGVQRGYEMHVLDRVETGRKPEQARAIGAVYHTSAGTLPGGFDAVLECTGALVGEAIAQTSPSGALCLLAGSLERSEGPLGNKAIVATVNSNRRHFEAGHDALRDADPAWLDRLLGPCVGLDEWRSAFDVGPDAIKAVICLGSEHGPGTSSSAGRRLPTGRFVSRRKPARTEGLKDDQYLGKAIQAQNRPERGRKAGR